MKYLTARDLITNDRVVGYEDTFMYPTVYDQRGECFLTVYSAEITVPQIKEMEETNDNS